MRLLPLAVLFLATTAVAYPPATPEPVPTEIELTKKKPLIQRVDNVTTTIGPRVLTDDLHPMFGARLDHALSDRWAGSITAGVIGDFDGVVGGTTTLGLDVHPFGGGLTGIYMGPRLTGNFRNTGTQLNAKLLWGYNQTIKPGLLIGAGVGPGIQTDLAEGSAMLIPAGEILLSLTF